MVTFPGVLMVSALPEVAVIEAVTPVAETVTGSMIVAGLYSPEFTTTISPPGFVIVSAWESVRQGALTVQAFASLPSAETKLRLFTTGPADCVKRNVCDPI